MISQAQHLINLVSAAAISAALFGFGLRGRPRESTRGWRKRLARWPTLAGGIFGAAMTGYVAFYADIQSTDIGIGTPIVVAVILVAIVVAALFMRLGLRGRRVGDHPFCRHCGFDLFGKPETSTVCNECGTDLATPRAVIVGVYQRRMIPLLGGLFVLILALAVAVPVGRDVWSWYQRKDFSSWKPESWLIADVLDAKSNGQSQKEVWQRFSDGSLSSEGIAKIIDHNLKLGAAASPRTWNSYTGDALQYVEAGWPEGKIDEALARRVLQACMDLSLDVAPRAAQGVVLRYCVRCADYGLASSDTSYRMSKLQVSTPRMTLGGIELPPDCFKMLPHFNRRTIGMLDPCGNAIALDTLGNRLPMGPASFEARFTATITLAVPDRPVLVETRDLVLKGSTTIVTREAMKCPPITVTQLKADGTIDADAPPINAAPGMIDRGGELSPMPQSEFLPRVAFRPTNSYRGDDRLSLQLSSPRLSSRGDAFFGQLSIRTADGTERPLGLVLIDSQQWEPDPLFITLPDDPFELIIRPTPERGCELFDPIPIYYSTTVIPSSAIDR